MGRPGSGNEAEAMVLAALVQRKFDVLVPFGEGQPYDLAVRLKHAKFLRVQCKTGWPVGGCLVFNSRSTDHGRGPQLYFGLADIFAVYFPPSGAVYLVPIDAIAASKGRLRLEPPRNNQRRGIRFAADFEIDKWTLESLQSVAETAQLSEDAVSVA